MDKKVKVILEKILDILVDMTDAGTGDIVRQEIGELSKMIEKAADEAGGMPPEDISQQ